MESEKVIYGIYPVIEALKSDSRGVSKILLSFQKKGKDIDTIKTLAQGKKIKLSLRNREQIDRVAGTTNHQGVVALIADRKFFALEDIVETCFQEKKDPVFLILDGITDSHNLGAIIRCSEVLGVDGILLPKDRSADITPLVSKTSAGAVEYMKIARITNVARAIDYLKEKGFWVYGADQDADKQLFNQDLRGPVALVLGNEKEGMRPLVKEKCDILISIPMKGKINSLNVSAASAVLSYEILRQRLKNKEEKSIDKK